MMRTPKMYLEIISTLLMYAGNQDIIYIGR
uniref:Macaca fascicularis brain cDNA, clone: QmoA-11138 n=1 Tax=Macaca fascicularis TaxID=9541 RepID=I7G8D0_MACFA|nr:unnamed protein product [Macaca fascicularis]